MAKPLRIGSRFVGPCPKNAWRTPPRPLAPGAAGSPRWAPPTATPPVTAGAHASSATARAARSSAKAKLDDRLAAAKAEQARHRADQVARPENVVLPRIDALLLVAEPVWRATVGFVRDRETRTVAARYLPRARRWVELPPG